MVHAMEKGGLGVGDVCARLGFGGKKRGVKRGKGDARADPDGKVNVSTLN